MYTKPEEQQKAQYLYLHTDLTQQEIADLLSVDRKTVYNWSREGCWTRAKYAIRCAPPVLVEQYYAQLGALNASIAARTEQPYPTKEEADTIRKLTMSIRSTPHENTLSSVLEVFADFMRHLRKTDRDATKEMVKHLDDYVKLKSNEGEHLGDWYASFFKNKNEEQEYTDWLKAYDEKNKADNRSSGSATEEKLPQAAKSQLDLPETTNGEFDEETDKPIATPEPLPVNISEEINNADIPVEKNEKWGISFKGHNADYYTNYLQGRYAIHHDKAIRRYTGGTIGITIISSASKLWGSDNCLFFEEKHVRE